MKPPTVRRTIKVTQTRFMSQINILVVDDNPDKLSLIEAALSLAGYNVTTARTVRRHLRLSSRISRTWL